MMISVCIATYNGEKFIERQLSSILKQLGQEDEVIVSDDGSTDKTLSIIKDFDDRRIVIINHAPLINYGNLNSITNNIKRQKCINNFENALKEAKGDIIFLSDQDDIWYENKVDSITSALKSHDLVVSDCNIIDHSDKIIANSRFEIKKPKLGFFSALYRNPFLGCCMAFNRKVLDRALPFPHDIPMHDIWIGMVAQTFYRPLLLKEVLVGYRRHENNINNNSESESYKQKKNISQYKLLEKIKFRFTIVKNLIRIQK